MIASRNLKLLIVLLITNGTFFITTHQAFAQDKNLNKIEPPAAVTVNKEVAPSQPPTVFTYTIHNNRDPFSPLVTPDGVLINPQPEGEISDIHLEGIIFDPAGKSYAVINGNVIAENDTIGGFVLKEIKKDKIILQNDENTHIIELIKEEPSEQQ